MNKNCGRCRSQSSIKQIAFFLAMILTAICNVPIAAYALDFDPHCLDIEKKSVPEGTYYVDVLIKLDKSDPDYCEVSAYNVPQCHVRYDYPSAGGASEVTKPLGITKDSGIARYSEDGYVSMSLHYRWVESFFIWDSEYNEQPGGYPHVTIDLNSHYKLLDVWEKHGPFKAAYVDKNGNVLGVSGKAKRSWSMSDPYALITDGDKLTFRSFGTSPASNIAFFALIVGVPLLILVCIALAVRNKIWKRRAVERIQHETEKL